MGSPKFGTPPVRAMNPAPAFPRARLTTWLTSLLTAISAPLAAQTSIVILNPSFETGSAAIFNEFTFGPPAGWQLYDPNGITDGGDGDFFYVGTLTPTPNGEGGFINFLNGAADGQRVAIAFNYSETGGIGEYGLLQTLDATLQANTTYSLQVDIGNIASGTAVDNTFFNLDGFPGYRVDLLAGDTVVASDNNTLSGTIAEGEFGLSVVQFTTGASHASLIDQPLTIRLVNLNVIDPAFPTADLEVDFDNVRFTATAIPEPAAWSWLALIAGGFAFLRRRRPRA